MYYEKESRSELKFQDAEDFLNDRYYGESLEACFTEWINPPEGFHVFLQGNDLRTPLNEFMNLVGTPSFVDRDSDYELVSEVLRNYKKRLRWGLFGKHVVDT